MYSWLITLLVVLVTAMALTGARSLPVTPYGRRLWTISIFVFGCLAIAGTVWQGRKQADEPTTLAGTSISPQGSHSDVDGPAAAELTRRIKALDDHVKALEAGRQARSIAQATADDLASYLKGFGSRRVIVSCAPSDIEAYQYANQLVNILKAAGWEAQGPEVTKIFGDVRGPGISVYVNGDDHSDTAKILLAGFVKFNIPYQSRVTPNGAIPDPDMVELFVGSKQFERANAGAD